MVNKKFVRFCYSVVFISTLFFALGYLFYLFAILVVKNKAVQYCSNVKWWATMCKKPSYIVFQRACSRRHHAVY